MRVTDISLSEMQKIRGGDWFETTWGIMVGSAFVAGFIGSGGFLAVAGLAGAALVMEDYL